MSSEHVKVMFFTHPDSGFPPEDWEGIWTIPLGDGKFKVDNIPFYVREVSCGDIVEAEFKDGEYIFKQVVKFSCNSTIRVVIYDLSHEESIRRFLESTGCAIEGSGIPGFVSLDVPPKGLEKVVKYLEREHADGRVDFEEGALR